MNKMSFLGKSNHNAKAKTEKKSLFEKIVYKAVDLIDKEIPTTSHYITKKQQAEIKKLLRPGDILLETNNEYPIFQFIEKATLGTDWTHMMMYMGNGKIAETTTSPTNGEKFSAKQSLDESLNAYHIAVVRPNYKTKTDKAAALQYMKDAEGRLYDDSYNTKDESALYCSEASYHALRKMPNPIKLPLTHILGRDIVSPHSVLKHPEMKMIWSSGSKHWKNQVTHYPLGVGALMGGSGLAYLGTLIGHPVALAICGAIAGFTAAWKVMRYIWPSLDVNS